MTGRRDRLLARQSRSTSRPEASGGRDSRKPPQPAAASAAPPSLRGGRVRCAIYTRKSSEEGLEQEFNSLDAQREACEAYVRSQKHEGWQALAHALRRPRLLRGQHGAAGAEAPARRHRGEEGRRRGRLQGRPSDPLARRLRQDRRGLRRERRLVRFGHASLQHDDHHGSADAQRAACPSPSSSARSLASASATRSPPRRRRACGWAASRALGYDVKDRKLIVNEAEAETVRMIFRRYLELGSVRELKAALDAEGVISKRRTAADGSPYGGQAFSRGALYQMLQNRVYRGEIVHKGAAYPGEHPADRR